MIYCSFALLMNGFIILRGEEQHNVEVDGMEVGSFVNRWPETVFCSFALLHGFIILRCKEQHDV
jgi:hypothetical protein